MKPPFSHFHQLPRIRALNTPITPLASNLLDEVMHAFAHPKTQEISYYHQRQTPIFQEKVQKNKQEHLQQRLQNEPLFLIPPRLSPIWLAMKNAAGTSHKSQTLFLAIPWLLKHASIENTARWTEEDTALLKQHTMKWFLPLAMDFYKTNVFHSPQQQMVFWEVINTLTQTMDISMMDMLDGISNGGVEPWKCILYNNSFSQFEKTNFFNMILNSPQSPWQQHSLKEVSAEHIMNITQQLQKLEQKLRQTIGGEYDDQREKTIGMQWLACHLEQQYMKHAMNASTTTEPSKALRRRM